MKLEHTATPWVLIKNIDGTFKISQAVTHETPVAFSEENFVSVIADNIKNQANAEMIVTRVNVHNVLIAALIDMLENGDADARRGAFAALVMAGVK